MQNSKSNRSSSTGRYQKYAAGCFALIIGLQGLPLAWAEQVPGVTDTEVVLGSHAMLTGTYSIFGIYSRVVKAYFDKINEQGGIAGRKVKFLIEDNGSKPQQSLLVTKKLVENEHVFAMAGSVGLGHMAVYPYLRENKVPDLWVANGYSAYTTPTHPTTFGFTPTFMNETKFFGEYIAQHFPGKKVGFGHGDSAESKQLSEVFIKALGDKAKLVSEQTNSTGVQTLNAEILALKQAGAEVVYMHWQPPLSATAIKFAAEQGYKPQWILTSGNANQKFAKLIGPELLEGAISWHYVYSDDMKDVPGVKNHLAFMKERLPSEIPSELSMVGQAIAETIEETLRRAGKNLTRESVLKAAEGFRDWKCSVCREANSTGPDKHLLTTKINPLIARSGKWESH